MSPYKQEHTMTAALAATIEVADSLSVMIEKERTIYLCHDYLEAATNSDSSNYDQDDDEHCDDDDDNSCMTMVRHREVGDKIITSEDRAAIVDWCYDMVDRCKFSRETVAIAMNIVDRFMSLPTVREDYVNDLSCSPQVDINSQSIISSQVPHFEILRSRFKYQLLSVTGLYIAIKLNERVAFGSKYMSALSNGMYSTQDIEDMEVKILNKLEWRLCSFPTPLQVGCHILKLMEENCFKATRTTGMSLESATFALLREELAFRTEIAAREYSCSFKRSSTVAIASLLHAIEQVSDDADCMSLMQALLHVMQRFEFEEHKDIFEVLDRMRRLMEENEEGKSNEDEGRVISSSDFESTATKIQEEARGFMHSYTVSPNGLSI